MMERFTVKHTGLSLWIHWLVIAGLMKLGHYLMDGYKPLTAWALLVAAGAIISAIWITIEEEYEKRRLRQVPR